MIREMISTKRKTKITDAVFFESFPKVSFSIVRSETDTIIKATIKGKRGPSKYFIAK